MILPETPSPSITHKNTCSLTQEVVGIQACLQYLRRCTQNSLIETKLEFYSRLGCAQTQVSLNHGVCPGYFTSVSDVPSDLARCWHNSAKVPARRSDSGGQQPPEVFPTAQDSHKINWPVLEYMWGAF